MDFKLEMGGIVYTARNSQSSGDSRSWDVSAEYNNFRINIGVPMEKKVSRAEIIVFITAFHETFAKVRKEQGEELRWLKN